MPRHGGKSTPSLSSAKSKHCHPSPFDLWPCLHFSWHWTSFWTWISYHLNTNTTATTQPLICLLSFQDHIQKFHKCMPCPSNDFPQTKHLWTKNDLYVLRVSMGGPQSFPKYSYVKQIRNDRKLNLHKVIHLYTISILTEAPKLTLATYWESITQLAEC